VSLGFAAIVLALGLQGTPSARWELAGDRAAVGEALRATLVVEHGAEQRAKLAADWLGADYSWLELEPARLDAASSATQTRWRVRLASLEAGERDLPRPQVELAESDGRTSNVEAELARARIQPVLFEGEDAPREPRDFRAADGEASTTSWPWLLAGGLAIAALAGFVGWKLRGRATVTPQEPSAAAQLAQLGVRKLDEASAVRELYYELTALVRRELDRRAGESRAACTDEEWAARVARTVDAECGQALSELVANARHVKYGGARPTEWAVREDLARAERVLGATGAAARSAA
jgi:hypothetical protein